MNIRTFTEQNRKELLIRINASLTAQQGELATLFAHEASDAIILLLLKNSNVFTIFTISELIAIVNSKEGLFKLDYLVNQFQSLVNTYSHETLRANFFSNLDFNGLKKSLEFSTPTLPTTPSLSERFHNPNSTINIPSGFHYSPPIPENTIDPRLLNFIDRPCRNSQ